MILFDVDISCDIFCSFSLGVFHHRCFRSMCVCEYSCDRCSALVFHLVPKDDGFGSWVIDTCHKIYNDVVMDYLLAESHA
jgi:hypothetical protein